jgi:protein-tyrosine phosphatase
MKKILFVCLGNFCRSPAAECILREMAGRANIGSDLLLVDSAAMGDWHVGERPDSRMVRAATRRGWSVDGFGRKLTGDDFLYFDYVVAMDLENRLHCLKLRPDGARAAIYLMSDFLRNYETEIIPDPNFGNADGFEYVLDLLEDACTGLLHQLQIDGFEGSGNIK